MTDFDEQMIPSKTARKREMDALQAVGKRLVELGDADLARIPINDEDLTEAIATAKRIKSREGLRRQMQYIGKLMRQVDKPAERFGVDLRTVACAGEPMGAELLEWGREALGVTFNEFYGQTECNLVTSNCGRLMEVRPGSMGRAVPGHTVEIIGPDGNIL
ncbi:ribosome biogenesis factor YjgA, partial [uncultured Spongiibacter sp.]|uniref:ribosome biogenesis factor YjgA n=1 Tax=uncultured Spongiibacter sp. TaxID=870896 RepID=UPI002595C769